MGRKQFWKLMKISLGISNIPKMDQTETASDKLTPTVSKNRLKIPMDCRVGTVPRPWGWVTPFSFADHKAISSLKGVQVMPLQVVSSLCLLLTEWVENSSNHLVSLIFTAKTIRLRRLEHSVPNWLLIQLGYVHLAHGNHVNPQQNIQELPGFLGNYRMGPPFDSYVDLISVAWLGRYNELVTGSYFMVYKPTYI